MYRRRGEEWIGDACPATPCDRRGNSSMRPFAFVFLACALLGGSFCRGEDASAERETTRRAMTLIRQNCLACHNPEKRKGKLVLTSRDLALKGGENGPALVPGIALRVQRGLLWWPGLALVWAGLIVEVVALVAVVGVALRARMLRGDAE